MKLLILRVVALLLAMPSFHSFAQNYYVRFSGDSKTSVADIASGFYYNGTSYVYDQLITYNVTQLNGDEDMGMIRLDGSQNLINSFQLHDPNGYILTAKRIFPAHHNNNDYILVERKDPNTSQIIPLIVEIDISGTLTNTYLLPALPAPYSYSDIFDITDGGNDKFRVLCTALDPNSGIKYILEAYCDISSLSTYFVVYAPQEAFYHFDGLYYIKQYHFGELQLGETAFYGTGVTEKGLKGFAFFKDIGVSTHYYETYYFSGSGQVSGMVANGSSANTPASNLITFAFSGDLGEFCLLQKSGLSSVIWKKYYEPETGDFVVSFGWGTHGIKGVNANDNVDYFIGNIHVNGNAHGPTILKFDYYTGNVYPSPEYNFTNPIPKLGYPNFCDDEAGRIYFLSDRYSMFNGFKLGMGNMDSHPTECTQSNLFKEIQGNLIEEPQDITLLTTQNYDMSTINLHQSDFPVSLIPECGTEQKHNSYITQRFNQNSLSRWIAGR